MCEKEMWLAYHGTSVPPQVVRKEGLRPICIEEVVARVKAYYNVGSEVDVLIQEHVARKRQHPFVYVTGDREIAISYAKTGGNFEQNLHWEIATYLEVDPYIPAVGFVYTVLVPERPDKEMRLSAVPAWHLWNIQKIGSE